MMNSFSCKIFKIDADAEFDTDNGMRHITHFYDFVGCKYMQNTVKRQIFVVKTSENFSNCP